ncbi:TerD family protein [Streptomyces polyrhachis]|uniref:TerD family protein n=1 Tax=Streptomyces polyrhachis TaxID=1282885 RepID=A0ABW2G773_9ACTN
MAAELVPGQNHPLPGARLEIRLSAGEPVIAGATLTDEHGRVPRPEWVGHPGAPVLPGLELPRQAAAEHRLAVDLGALPEAVRRVNILLALPTGTGRAERFGALSAPHAAITTLDGTRIAGFTVTGLDAESAVFALELYERQGAWKVRAAGQGYAGGLAAMLADQGLPDAAGLAARINAAVSEGLARAVAAAPPPTVPASRTPAGGVDYRHPTRRPASPGAGPDTPAPPPDPGSGPGVDYRHPVRSAPAAGQPTPAGRPPAPVAGDAAGWSLEERLYNQVWGMFEDLTRSVAAYRSAVDFADSRLERELEDVLADPRSRIGTAADAAREAADARHGALVGQARAALDRDLAQLIAESAVVEPALPPPYARWDSACWHSYQVPAQAPMALRLGDLSLEESGPLRIPMLMRLPLQRGLWIDTGSAGALGPADADQVRHDGVGLAVSLAARLLAAYPADAFAVHVIDPDGAAAAGLAPLRDAGLLAAPPAAGAAGVRAVLEELTQRVDLVQMAIRSGATDALPPGTDAADRLLIVHDFPHGFDERAVTQLRYLADEGAQAGVHLMLVADRAEAEAYGPLLDPLWRGLLRVTPLPEDHLADPWIGHAWTYEPPTAADRGETLARVLARVAQARRSRPY